MSENEHPIRTVNRCLYRLPLILDILDELHTEHEHPGDQDLKHGSHQAVCRMMERLRSIRPTAEGVTQPPDHEVAIAHTWLLGERPRKLLPPSVYAELSRMVGTLTTGSPEMSGQAE
jgi:hypothetical protein